METHLWHGPSVSIRDENELFLVKYVELFNAEDPEPERPRYTTRTLRGIYLTRIQAEEAAQKFDNDFEFSWVEIENPHWYEEIVWEAEQQQRRYDEQTIPF